MFPVTIAGRVESSTIAVEQIPVIVAALKSALTRARASDVSDVGNKVTFRAGAFRLVSNWNVLVPVGSGVFEIHAGSPGAVEFRFSCIQMLVIVTLMVSFAAIIIPRNQPLLFRLGAPLALWLWLFGHELPHSEVSAACLCSTCSTRC